MLSKVRKDSIIDMLLPDIGVSKLFFLVLAAVVAWISSEIHVDLFLGSKFEPSGYIGHIGSGTVVLLLLIIAAIAILMRYKRFSATLQHVTLLAHYVILSVTAYLAVATEFIPLTLSGGVMQALAAVSIQVSLFLSILRGCIVAFWHLLVGYDVTSSFYNTDDSHDSNFISEQFSWLKILFCIFLVVMSTVVVSLFYEEQLSRTVMAYTLASTIYFWLTRWATSHHQHTTTHLP